MSQDGMVPKDQCSTEAASLPRAMRIGLHSGEFAVIADRQTLEYLPVESIQIGRYQRPLNKLWARRIADHFDPYAFGLLTVGRRFDGSQWAIDGQTRLAAAKLIGEAVVPCVVIAGTTESEEARKFLQQGTGKKPSPVDSYHGAVVAGRPVALEIKASLDAAGFKVPKSTGGSYGINCIQRICGLHAHGDGLLDEVLGLLRDSYGGEARDMTGSLVAGLSEFVVTYRGLYRREIAVKRFSSVPQEQVHAKAFALRSSLGMRSTGGSVGRSYAMTYRGIYETPAHTLPDRTYRPWFGGNNVNAAAYLDSDPQEVL